MWARTNRGQFNGIRMDDKKRDLEKLNKHGDIEMRTSKHEEERKRRSQELERMVLVVNDDPRPLILPGIYRAVMIRMEKKQLFTNEYSKLFVHFRIIDDGPFHGTELYRSYNLHRKTRRETDLFKELKRINGRQVKKGERLPLKLFGGRVLKVSVRTVEKNAKQMALPDDEKYSVIAEVLGAEEVSRA